MRFWFMAGGLIRDRRFILPIPDQTATGIPGPVLFQSEYLNTLEVPGPGVFRKRFQ